MSHRHAAEGEQSRVAMSRRSFLRATGIAAAGTAVVEEAMLGLASPARAEPAVAGPGGVPMMLDVNGRARTADGRAQDDPGRGSARTARADRDEDRMRPRGLLGLHGLDRRRSAPGSRLRLRRAIGAKPGSRISSSCPRSISIARTISSRARSSPRSWCRRLVPRRGPSTSSRASAALTGASALTKNAYKLPIFETLVRRAILVAAGRA